MSPSPDFGAPLSTSTRPSPADKTTTLLPPASTMPRLSVKRRRPVADCWAPRSNGDAHNVSIPVTVPFKTSLRSPVRPSMESRGLCLRLEFCNDTRAVRKLFTFHAGLLEQRQEEVCHRRTLRQCDLLAAEFQLPVSAADHNV